MNIRKIVGYLLLAAPVAALLAVYVYVVGWLPMLLITFLSVGIVAIGHLAVHLIHPNEEE